METKIIDVLQEVSLIENNMLWNVCTKCGHMNKLDGNTSCANCGWFFDSDSIYPHLAALDMAYSLVLLNELSIEAQKGLIKLAMKNLTEDLHKEIIFGDVDYLLQCIYKLRNSDSPFETEKFNKLVRKRLGLELENDVEQVTSELLTGTYINRLYKPFIVTCASFIELLFKDYVKVVLKASLGEKSGIQVLKLYEHKSINDFIDFLNILLESSLEKQINSIKASFYQKWDTLRKDRNKVIHNNNISAGSKKVCDAFAITKDAVLVFGTLKSQYLLKR